MTRASDDATWAGDWTSDAGISSAFDNPESVRAHAPATVYRSPDGAALTDVLYLQEPGDTAPISVNDLHQDGLGDCFPISPIGELALNDPSAIQDMIQSNANGTETVTLHEAEGGGRIRFSTTEFQAVQVTVTNKFNANAVNSQPGQDVVGDEKEIWPQVLEKAYAKINGGYNAINNGGHPALAMETLTGQPATSLSPGQVTLADLQN